MGKPFWRLLRSYRVAMAAKDHTCRFCYQRICVGDSYIASVYVSIEHRIIVEREHEFCEPDDPWDEDEWKYWDQDDHIPEISPKETAHLPMAA